MENTTHLTVTVTGTHVGDDGVAHVGDLRYEYVNGLFMSSHTFDRGSQSVNTIGTFGRIMWDGIAQAIAKDLHAAWFVHFILHMIGAKIRGKR